LAAAEVERTVAGSCDDEVAEGAAECAAAGDVFGVTACVSGGAGAVWGTALSLQCAGRPRSFDRGGGG